MIYFISIVLGYIIVSLAIFIYQLHSYKINSLELWDAHQFHGKNDDGTTFYSKEEIIQNSLYWPLIIIGLPFFIIGFIFWGSYKLGELFVRKIGLPLIFKLIKAKESIPEKQICYGESKDYRSQPRIK